jgi:hypothetical protein
MNTLKNTLLLLPICLSLASCQEDPIPKYKTAITVHVQDENALPINDVDVEIVHNEAGTTAGYKAKGKTDASGNYTYAERSLWTIHLRCSRDGYYPARIKDYLIADKKDIIQKKVHIDIVLKKITNPIALYAKQNDVPIPEKEKWIGFDLQECDWVKPYGKGKESDVEFLLQNKALDVPMSNGQSGADRIAEIKEMHDKNPSHKASYMEHRDEFFNLPKGTSTYDQAFAFRVHPWRGTLKMRIPSEKGGLIAEKVNYLLYSKSPSSDYVHLPVTEMRMPYHAPTTGYQAEYSWEKIPGQTLAATPAEFGFFIKTRIKLDEKGNVISAHYAKFITNLEIDIRGRIKFTSYFNPTANDTNLECDVKKNIFKNLNDLEKPYLP